MSIDKLLFCELKSFRPIKSIMIKFTTKYFRMRQSKLVLFLAMDCLSNILHGLELASIMSRFKQFAI